MGASKTEIHTSVQIEIAEIAKVLSHPARVAILDYISKQDACICTDLVDEIGLSQPTISQHLQVIRNAGLLKGTFEGKRLCYCIDMERFQEIQQLLNQFFNHTAAQCC
ncbi:MAG TPA: metalloregulator ArsR/SmtB family transcription factor [Flavobacteriaceae bacterium]|nr:winged helix-turn-helix transcriptional regulator [Flavobacteriaceae bacterium]MCB9212159.1 winged helix-turn-helix transcriptional regulator [Alteromonas sp.]HPF10463.1 metalloregulator ArsR/SmtB family transcription factor [Flavobacteriaceae bacterium]HQU21772.1 metalloregulator ArsR/SmtB family transcription factor [Flavobacteriaceae bacterium]HQU64674.1 metalloregulator ArsR/SmtB family transcription factor [Flavobacteriaceae bacterium]